MQKFTGFELMYGRLINLVDVPEFVLDAEALALRSGCSLFRGAWTVCSRTSTFGVYRFPRFSCSLAASARFLFASARFLFARA